eukprot:GHVU01195990.1.p1 GENE.GHVU01195990.1~~GHVU01195990.1.p1  ORF type:complete len:372 (+),score=42.17 GHVU01195990.1:3507-4622(+)
MNYPHAGDMVVATAAEESTNGTAKWPNVPVGHVASTSASGLMSHHSHMMRVPGAGGASPPLPPPPPPGAGAVSGASLNGASRSSHQVSTMQLHELKARDVVEKLMADFELIGEPEPLNNCANVLRNAIAIARERSSEGSGGVTSNADDVQSFWGDSGDLHHRSQFLKARAGGNQISNDNSPNSNMNGFMGGIGGVPAVVSLSSSGMPTTTVPGGRHFAAPTVLAHPDEFKNPSSFLKIYGDPLCRDGKGPGDSGNLPNLTKGLNGNWTCRNCSNVNFPRRFRCNKCSAQRDEEGDRSVAEYAKQVYRQHVHAYREQQASQGKGESCGGGSGGGSGGGGRGKRIGTGETTLTPVGRGHVRKGKNGIATKSRE